MWLDQLECRTLFQFRPGDVKVRPSIKNSTEHLNRYPAQWAERRIALDHRLRALFTSVLVSAGKEGRSGCLREANDA